MWHCLACLADTVKDASLDVLGAQVLPNARLSRMLNTFGYDELVGLNMTFKSMCYSLCCIHHAAVPVGSTKYTTWYGLCGHKSVGLQVLIATQLRVAFGVPRFEPMTLCWGQAVSTAAGDGAANVSVALVASAFAVSCAYFGILRKSLCHSPDVRTA